jgi:peptide/nickel transport system permease protein
MSKIVGRWLLRTIAIVVPVFFFASFLTFGLREISHIDPTSALLGENASPEKIHNLRVQWGLDRPFLTQYWDWLSGCLSGDLGKSWYSKIDVTQMILQRAPISLSVALFALAIGVVFGSLLGCLGALTFGSWLDRALTLLLSIATAIPAFVIAVALIVLFSVLFPVFPSAGYHPLKLGFLPWLRTITLPAVALSFDTTAELARQLRSSIVATYGQNYIFGARARGYGEARIFFLHALPNSLGPFLAVLGLKFPALLGGAVVTETIFNMNGYGKFAADSSLRGDVPAVQGVLLVAVVLVLIFSVLVNLIQLRLNPGSERGF